MNSLQGKRIVVTRARIQAAGLAEALAERGAVPILLPTIEIAPLADPARLDLTLAQLHGYQWVIFTSANGVSAVWERLPHVGLDSGTFQGRRVAAIGPATARALAQRGVRAALVPDEYVAEAIVTGLGEVAGQWILLPRAELAREVLADELGRRGALVHELPAYRTLPTTPDPAGLGELTRGVDFITFASASAARNFVAMVEKAQLSLRQIVSGTQVACIGPVTAQATRELGLPVHVQAEVYTTEGLLQALERHCAAEAEE